MFLAFKTITGNEVKYNLGLGCLTQLKKYPLVAKQIAEPPNRIGYDMYA